MKEPCVMVPVTTFLELVRLYKENPQEVCSRQHWLASDQLERVAYRKYLAYKKELRNEHTTAG